MNWVSNRIEPVEENKTKRVAENEFQFSGFMKLIGLLMPGSFKKESCKYMTLFKNFAEGTE